MLDVLLAEDVLTVARHPQTGRVRNRGLVPLAVAGGLLVDLHLSGYVTLGPAEGRWERRRVQTSLSARPSDPMLAAALDVAAAQQQTPSHLVNHLRRVLYEQIEQTAPQPGRRQGLEEELVTWWSGEATDDRTRACAGLLWNARLLDHAFPHPGASSRAVERRGRAAVRDDWTLRAVFVAELRRQASWGALLGFVLPPWS